MSGKWIYVCAVVAVVCLLEADGLVAMVDAKLREPQQLPLGSDGLQRLFTVSGLLAASHVRETLG